MRKTWGNSKLRFCPLRKKVWNLELDRNNLDHILYIFRDMPSYGLERIQAPIGYKEKVV